MDPGHGGEEKGAIGHYYKGKGAEKKKVIVYEKDLTLRLAKKLKRQLEKKFKVYLTRSVDRTVGLQNRAKMAEMLKADYFISIHFNSNIRREVRGFETYYLNHHKNAVVKKIENTENNGFGPGNTMVNQILIDLVIERTQPQSRKMAQIVHRSLEKTMGRKFRMVNRGVKPGLFYVLALTKRPAILLEGGFLSNEKELKELLTNRFQTQYAKGVAKGLEQYILETRKKRVYKTETNYAIK